MDFRGFAETADEPNHWHHWPRYSMILDQNTFGNVRPVSDLLERNSLANFQVGFRAWSNRTGMPELKQFGLLNFRHDRGALKVFFVPVITCREGLAQTELSACIHRDYLCIPFLKLAR